MKSWANYLRLVSLFQNTWFQFSHAPNILISWFRNAFHISAVFLHWCDVLEVNQLLSDLFDIPNSSWASVSLESSCSE